MTANEIAPPRDKTALSYWLPMIMEAGLPVPRTQIVRMKRDQMEAFFTVFDGEEPGAKLQPFFDAVKTAANVIGYPCFLRTDHTSNKHSWDRSCFLASEGQIQQHVLEIIEFSEICDFIGLPWDVWAIREMLPIMPAGTCPRYGNMPVNREFRFFVREGDVICHHPYWPDDALEKGGFKPTPTFDRAAFNSLTTEEHAHLTSLASRAGLAVGGAWSIDFLETTRGWFLTDMAEAHKSFHWDGCEHEFRRKAIEEAGKEAA